MEYYINLFLPGMALMSAIGLVWIWLPKLLRVIFNKEQKTIEDNFMEEQKKNNNHKGLEDYFN